MKLTKDKTSGVYKVRIFTPSGVKVISTKTRDRKEAVQFASDARLEKLEHQAKTGNLSSLAVMALMKDNAVTMEKAFSQWLAWLPNTNAQARTVDNYRSHLEAWMNQTALTGKSHPSSVTEADVHTWINNPSDRTKLATRTVRLTAVRSFFEFCCAKGWCPTNPARLVRVKLALLTHKQRETTKRQPFTDEEIDEVLDQARPGSFWHVAIVIARHIGLRLGDICQLEWSCLSKPGKIVVWMDKTEQRLELSLPAPVRRALTCVSSSDDTYLFPTHRNTILDPKLRHTLSTQFSRLCAKAGVKGKSFHSLRCTYAVELKRMGIPMVEISAALGHRDTKVTERYV